MITETIGNAYTAIENKFYAFFDFLEEKGLPVYSVIDPIEGKGIPFFPLTIALIAILIVSIVGFGVVGTAFEAKLSLNLKDNYNEGLQQVHIIVEDGTGQELFTGIKNNGDEITIKSFGGTEIIIKAEKEGYEGNQITEKIINEYTEVNLNLKKLINTAKVKIQFFDEETQTTIAGVYGTIKWKEIEKEATADSKGIIEFLDIPLEEDIYITAVSDSYYEYTGVISFESEETKAVYLTPKEIAFEGESNLIITLFDEQTGELIENAKVKVFDATSNELIDEKIVTDGVYSENFPKGTAVRFTIEKDDYKLFESDEFTLRAEEENFGAAELEKGGKEVIITVVYSDTKNPAVGAEVTLYNSDNEIIDSSLTLYEGMTQFKGLAEEQEYYVGAVKEDYLPSIKKIENDSETIELTKETEVSTRELTILIVDPNEQIVENASLYFTEIINEGEIPLGTGVKETNAEGKFTLTLRTGIEVSVKAVKDLLEGKERILIEDHQNNNLLIKLEKKGSVKSIKFFDETGQITQGTLVIRTKEGLILFDDEITEEEILIDTGEKNFIEIELITAEGKKYTEEINVEGKTDLEINFDSAEYNEQIPDIEFLGIFDVSGNEVEGITKGNEYILKFKTEWMNGLKAGGIHFRTGNDSIKYSDSEDIGITGFDAATMRYFFGRSYSPRPLPGYQDIDFSNKGQGGKFNKFVEMYFDEPEGTKIIKVRIKASELISQDTIKVNYRAWSELNGNYNRNPIDEVLGTQKTTEEKQGLYAETTELEIKVYETEPECTEEVCVEYNLIDSEGRNYDKKDFFALTGKVYALEIKLEARKSTQATIKLNTSNENPRIAFTGNEINSFSQFIDNENTDTLTELNIDVPREGAKTRIYFKGKTEGESYIKTRITTPNDSLTENFYFKVFEEKEMQVEVQEEIQEGRAFEIKVKDDTGKGIENAEIIIYNEKGRLEETIIADEFNGRNGIYEIKNNFKAGNYLIKVKADKFAEQEKEIQIVYGQGIEIQEKIELNIPVSEPFVIETATITNLTGEMIDGLTAEIITAGNFPKEFNLEVMVPMTLNSGEENEITVNAEYTGNEKAVLHGEAEAIITGTIKGIAIKTKTKIIINYNQKIKEDCLEFDRTELKEYLIGAGGNSKQLELGIKNNCGMPLEFELEAIPKGHSDGEIVFSTGTTRIEKDEVKNIKIGVINQIQRNYSQQTTLEYDLFFNSSQLTKSIPIKIILWNELFALEVNPTIVLWLTQSQKGTKGTAGQAIYIRNTGLTDIQNLSFATQFEKPGNTEITLLWGDTPKKDVEILKKGMMLIPPMVIQAETDTVESYRIIGKLVVTGNIEGKQYALREINVFINVSSGWSCLEAWSDDMQFYAPTAEFGSIDKIINITNNCTEPVIITGIEPEKIGGNEITLMEKGYLAQGQNKEFILRLTKSTETNQKTSIKIKATGQNSRKPIVSMPTEIEIAIGKGTGLCGDAQNNKPCKGENEMTIEYCDGTGSATLFFPKQSDNCSEGYCDAEQLGKFLAEKFQEEIRKAQLRIAEVKSAENLGSKCNQYENYCSFGAMGITSSSFDFYLKNDNLSNEMLESEIDKIEMKELQNYITGLGTTEQDLYSSAGNAFGEHKILTPIISGCGKYSAKIIGAIALSGNEIRSNSITLLLKIENGREETPECTNRIQNFVNFIPVNESYSISNNKSSWLGTIITDEKTKELQKSFSKTLFKDEKGIRVSSSRQNNFIEFKQGGFDSTKGIVKIAMERKGESNEPKEIDVYITDNFFNSSEEIEKSIALEAGTIISNLKNGRIEKGCISTNFDYLILGSVKSISEIANIQWKDETKAVNLYPNTETCVNLKLQSKIEAPEAKLEWRLIDEELQGIIKDETVFRYPDGKEITNKGEKGFNLSKALWKQEGNDYSLDFKLCFMGSDNPRNAIDSKIKLEITGLEERELVFGLCAITPVEFVKRAQGKTDAGKWYATVNWEGDPNELPFNIAQQQFYINNPESDPSKKMDDQLSSRKTVGLIGYGAGAIAGCAGLLVLTGGVGTAGAIDCLINAGVPIGLAMFSDEQTVYGAAADTYEKTLESLGVKQTDINALKAETEMKNEYDLLWNLEKNTAETASVKEALKLLVPASEDAKKAAETAKEIQKIGTSDLTDELKKLKTEITSYNSTKTSLKKAGIEGIGTIEKPVAGGKQLQRIIQVNGKITLEGTSEFITADTQLRKAFQGLRIGGNPVNSTKLIEEAFAQNTGGKTINPNFLIDNLAANPEYGTVKKLSEFYENVKARADPNTKAGTELIEKTKKYVEKASEDIYSGETVKRPTGATETALKNLIEAPKAIPSKNKFLTFLEKNPKLKRLGKGLTGAAGAAVGGWLGGLLADAISGDIKQIAEPESDTMNFEKTFTYKVEVRKIQSGDSTYSYSKMNSTEIKDIPEGRRLDNDSCDGKLTKLELTIPK